MSFPRHIGGREVGEHMPDDSSIQKGDKQWDGNQRNIFPQDTTEKKKEGKSVNQSAGTDVPSRFADNEGQQSGSDPDDHKNTSGYPPVEIEQAPW